MLGFGLGITPNGLLKLWEFKKKVSVSGLLLPWKWAKGADSHGPEHLTCTRAGEETILFWLQCDPSRAKIKGLQAFQWHYQTMRGPCTLALSIGSQGAKFCPFWLLDRREHMLKPL